MLRFPLLNFKARLSDLVKRIISPWSQLPANRTGAYLGSHRYLTTTTYGHKIYLDTRDVSLTPHLIINGYWELWITRCIESYLRPGMRVLEVGSNCGWYTLLIADKIGPEGKLIAFEANPDMARMAFDSAAINGFENRVKIHNLAVSDTNGEATFRILSRFLGASTLGTIGQGFLDYLHEDLTEITVKTVALDDFLQGGDRTIDLMKIDAEGAEPLVFQGMQKLLQENQTMIIVMEYSTYRVHNGAQRPQDSMKMLFDLGFKAFRIEVDGSLTPQSLADLNAVSHCELLLSRQLPKPAGSA